jgi:hypothetical protein
MFDFGVESIRKLHDTVKEKKGGDECGRRPWDFKARKVRILLIFKKGNLPLRTTKK